MLNTSHRCHAKLMHGLCPWSSTASLYWLSGPKACQPQLTPHTWAWELCPTARDSLHLAPKGSINQIAVLCRGEAWGIMGLKNKAHAACSEWAAALSTTGIVPTRSVPWLGALPLWLMCGRNTASGQKHLSKHAHKCAQKSLGAQARMP